MDINELLGVPYKPHGRDLDGMDCYGLAIAAAACYGFKLDDALYDCNALDLSDELKPTLNIYPTPVPFPGALLEMHAGNELHVGICLNSRDFIHMTKNGARVNRIGVLPVRGVYGIDTRI